MTTKTEQTAKTKIQQRIDNARIKVIGLGGIGSLVSLYLSQFLYSQDSQAAIVLIDGDEYELRNRDRVMFEDFTNKALAKVAEFSAEFGDRLYFEPIQKYVSVENVNELVLDGDIVFLAVDNHASRKTVSDHCEKLANVVLISGGNDGVEDGKEGTFGNVQIYVRRDGQDVTHSLTRYHHEIANPQDHSPEDTSCGDLIAQGSAPQLLFTNLAVASAMLNAFYAWLTEKLSYEEVYLDILQARMSAVSRTKRPTNNANAEHIAGGQQL